jgi:hypothetical protein
MGRTHASGVPATVADPGYAAGAAGTLTHATRPPRGSREPRASCRNRSR